MQDIIKAMRVLAELSDQVGTELDSLVDESKYKDKMVITSRMAAMETFCYLGELLGKAADRLESDMPKEGEWIEHNGDGQPIQTHVYVEVKNREGVARIGVAENWSWFWSDRPSDIIAYRVVKP